jgi:hypothetical protein
MRCPSRAIARGRYGQLLQAPAKPQLFPASPRCRCLARSPGEIVKSDCSAGVNGEGPTMSGESEADGLPGGVGLAEAIEALRAELAQAM